MRIRKYIQKKNRPVWIEYPWMYEPYATCRLPGEITDFAIATAHGSRHVRCKSEDAAAVGSQVSRSVTSSYWAQGVTVKSPVRGFPFWGRTPNPRNWLVPVSLPLWTLTRGATYIYMCVCQIYMSQWDVQSDDILSGFGYCSDLFRAIFQCLPFLVAAFFLSHFVPGTIPDLPCNPRHSNSRERPHPPSP